MGVIVSDLGGVVIRFDRAACHQCWSRVSPLTVHQVAARIYPDDQNEAFERGEIAPAQYLAHVRDSLRTGATDERLAACFNAGFRGVDELVVDILSDGSAQRAPRRGSDQHQ